METKGKKTILLADDNLFALDFIRGILESFGFRVIIAIDGQELVKRFESYIDLILTDTIMPNLSGLEAVKKLKSSGRLRNTPVIFMYSLPNNLDIEELEQFGSVFEKYIPYRDRLLDKINELIAAKEKGEK